MATERISLDEIYANDKCEGSAFRAVKMMSEEARFINEQANMGFIELSKKPTTIAMSKFKAEKLECTENTSNDELETLEEYEETE